MLLSPARNYFDTEDTENYRILGEQHPIPMFPFAVVVVVPQERKEGLLPIEWVNVY
jgi:hypothetical protein